MRITLPRFSPPVWIVFGALLLLVYVGLSWISIVTIVLGSGILLYAYWNGNKPIGIVGYLIFAFGTTATTDVYDLASVSNIARTGFLLVLPLSISLWFTLTMGTEPDSQAKIDWLPYTVAMAFAALVLMAVPIAGLILQSVSYVADTGEESQIMLIGFATAVWSAVVLGIDRKK